MRARLPAVSILVAGAAASAIWVWMTSRMSFKEFFPGPGITVDLPKMLGPDWKENTRYVLGCFAVLSVAWVVVLVVSARAAASRWTTGLLFLGPVVFVGILVFMYPPQAVDFIHNVSDGRTLFNFGDNPMVVPPDANHFPVGQSYGPEPAPYGPLWFLLEFPVAPFKDNILTQLYVLKAWTSAFYLGTAVLVFLTARRLAPDRQYLALALYAWNPFVVLRIAGNGHNDAAMIFFAALAFWLIVAGRSWAWMLPVLAAAVLTKYTAALIVPVVLVGGLVRAEDKRVWLKQAAIGAVLALGLVAAVVIPLWEGSDTFDAVRDQAGKFITSTPAYLNEYFKFHSHKPEADAADQAKLIGNVAFAVTYLLILFAGWRERFRGPSLIAACALVLLSFCLFSVTWFRPWYMLFPITLLAVVPGRAAVALVIAISIGGLMPDLIEQYRTNIKFFLEHYLWAIAAPIIPAFIPALIAWVIGAVLTRSLLLTPRVRARSEPASLDNAAAVG